MADRRDPAFRRLAVNVSIQSGLGRFFAGKLRAGVLYALYRRSGDETALREAIQYYRGARAAWSELAAKAEGVYVRDITFGRVPHLRGHWADRLAAINQDLADMEAMEKHPADHLKTRSAKGEWSSTAVEKAVRVALAPPHRLALRASIRPRLLLSGAAGADHGDAPQCDRARAPCLA